MSGAAGKKKSFRSRGGEEDDDDEEEDTGPALLRRPATSSKAKAGKKSGASGNGGGGGAGKKPSSAMLSFDDDEDEDAGPLARPLPGKSKLKKKAFASKSLEKAMAAMEGGGGGAADASAAAAAAGGGGPSGGYMASASAGEYTAEKLAALKKGQNFQVSTKASKASARGARVTFVGADGSTPAALHPEEGGGGEGGIEGEDAAEERALDEAEIRRLKKEKRERMLREAMESAGGGGSGGGGGGRGEEDEEEDDYIPLDGSHRRERPKGEGEEDRRLDKASLPADQAVEDDWESEMIRRGARKGPSSAAASAAAAAAAANGGALSSSLSRLAMGGGVGGGGLGAAPAAFKSVASVLKDLRETKARVDEAHEKNERAAAKARGELEAGREGVAKLQREFDETAERFQFFQDTREYIASLCGCLREKEGMVRELEAAVAQVRRDAADRRWRRRLEDQEDALDELAQGQQQQEQQQEQGGPILSLQGYVPTVLPGLLAGGQQHQQQQQEEEELDEFGRSKGYADGAARERRRAARLARREKALRRLGQGQGQGSHGAAGEDTAEAEARLSGAEDSDTEAAVTAKREATLLEASGVIFEDAAEDFGALDPVVRRFEAWKRAHPKDYQAAFVSAALPQVVEPFVRVEMARWNPLGAGADRGEAALEGFGWFERLFSYGQGGDGEGALPAADDPDDRLVPTLVEKVAAGLLQRLLGEAYDPCSSTETARAVAAIQALLIYEPGKHAMEQLLQAPLERLRAAIRALCVPLLRPSAGAEAVAFQRRQIFRGVKLYGNLGQWHEVLAPRALSPLALGSVLEGTLAPALENRLDNDSGSSGGSNQGGGGGGGGGRAAVEVLGTLEALLQATPPAWLLDKAAPSRKAVGKVLDKVAQRAGGAAPILATVERLRTGFGVAMGGGGSG